MWRPPLSTVRPALAAACRRGFRLRTRGAFRRRLWLRAAVGRRGRARGSRYSGELDELTPQILYLSVEGVDFIARREPERTHQRVGLPALLRKQRRRGVGELRLEPTELLLVHGGAVRIFCAIAPQLVELQCLLWTGRHGGRRPEAADET